MEGDRLVLDDVGYVPNRLSLTLQECIDLRSFIVRAGYISHELDQPIHDLFKRVDNFVEERKS